MRKIKLTKETIGLSLILILSSILNFANLTIEGYGNQYYAACVKSMTMSLKNFFFVAFDPSGFVSIDKPPFGFWIQAIFAKIFGFSGWSIIFPQALAGVVSVGLIYLIVKRAFGSLAGLISALCLAITPVFVAASRNNTIDNLLVLALLFACWALSIAAEKGKFKYLIISMVLVGIGFNIKMLQAYMIAPALYVTYLLSTAVSIKKRIVHLIVASVVLIAVSLSWALVVDLVPAGSRPYVDSSTNNTVMELIVGHNGLERLGLSSKTNNGGGNPGGGMQSPNKPGENINSVYGTTKNQSSLGKSGGNSSNSTEGMQGAAPNGNGQGFPYGNGQGMPGNPPSGNGQKGMGPMVGGKNMKLPNGGGSGGLSGNFGNETKAGITRLFSKNILSDQIVWFIPLAVLGFIAALIKEKLRFKLNNTKKQSLTLWFMWLLPVFIYFSFTTGLFHSYYLTMLAPPIAALTGIGISEMWELYKEGGWKAWFLPLAMIANGAVQLSMLHYFDNSSYLMKVLMILIIIMCFVPSVTLIMLNSIKKKAQGLEDNSDYLKQSKSNKLKKILVGLALIGVLITPLVGASTVLFYQVNSSFPAAGLELLSNIQVEKSKTDITSKSNTKMSISTNSNSKLIDFLKKHKTNEKYILVVASANDASDIIIKTGESIMALGGFLGSDKVLSLTQFKELAKKGEVRYVMVGGMGGGNSSSEIMNWVKENGKAVLESEYSSASISNNQMKVGTANNKLANSKNQSPNSFGFGNFKQLYDLKSYTDSSATQ